MSALSDRLAAVGLDVADVVAGSLAPEEAWLALYQREGRTAGLLDLYELAALAERVFVDELLLATRRRLAAVVLPLRYPGWQEVPGSKSRPDPVDVVPYDPSWPLRFAGWRHRLLGALPDLPGVRIAHVGSTAVPGLTAKPIVDVQMSVSDHADESAYVSAVAQLGLELRSRDEEHRYFRPPPPRPRDVHLHVCTAGSGWERDHLLLRDYLRQDDSARDAYGQLKIDLALQWANDRIAYTEAKTRFIVGTLREAETWAASAGWSVAGSDGA